MLNEKVTVLTEKLTALQKIYKSLEQKYDRVMRFIEYMKPKEKLADFLRPKKHTR